jgi:hypothetical protein
MIVLNNDFLLLNIEKDLEARFDHVVKNSKIQKVTMDLRSIYAKSLYKTIYKRLVYKEKILLEYKKIKSFLIGKKVVLLSNGEGFVAKNIISFILKDFPNIILVVLQHGIFVTEKPKKINQLIRFFLNSFFRLFFKVYVFGTGFGFANSHKYIVYNETYKRYLQSINILPENIIVSSFFLKGEGNTSHNNVKNDSALFLLQCLSELNITTKKYENFLCTTIIRSLSNTYKKVLIKQHPYCTIKLENLPDNCFIESANVSELISKSTIMISFFSTALLEYENIDIPCVAVFSDKLKVDLRQYQVFKYISDIDILSKERCFSFKENKPRVGTKIFFEKGIFNYNQVLNKLGVK